MLSTESLGSNQWIAPIIFSALEVSRSIAAVASLVSLITLTGCATTKNGKLLEYGLIGGLIGGMMGAQKAEMKDANMTLYSSVGALAGVSLAAAMDDSDAQIKELNAKIKFLDSISSGGSSISNSISGSGGSASNPNAQIEELPEEFRPLMQTHHYEIYKINRWARRGPNYLVKESEMIKLNEKR